jgi:hypothetical protein
MLGKKIMFKIIREHAQNCDVPCIAPCPTLPRSPQLYCTQLTHLKFKTDIM